MSNSKVYYAPYFSSVPIEGGHAVVSANSYAAAQSELAALREELASETERANANALRERHAKQDLNSIQQRLAAAEQRNAEQLQELVKARELIEQASKFRASTFSDCSELILSLQAFVAETEHAGEYITVRRDLLNTACNGYVQEQGHALNQLRDLLSNQTKPTESGASK